MNSEGVGVRGETEMTWDMSQGLAKVCRQEKIGVVRPEYGRRAVTEALTLGLGGIR